jgi:Astacin (Peptidase family M12A)
MAFVSSDPTRFWCGGGIPYEVADDIFLDDVAKEILREAVDNWNAIISANNIVAVRLFARFQEETQPDYLVFTKHPTTCSSPIGRQGGPQLVGCPIGGAGDFQAGSVMHEVAHAVGFQHEQCRPDRGEKITINWDNIKPGEEDNFCRNIPNGQAIGEYDYGSLMHYSADAFSANGLDTIVPKDPNAVIGQRVAPSPGDIQAMGGLCVNVPYVQELPPAIAAQRLRDIGLRPSFAGDPHGTFVWQQSPRSGRVVGRGTVVTLQLRGGEMPALPPVAFNILDAKFN